jgi:FAD/FMN-containing dehydrogenase
MARKSTDESTTKASTSADLERDLSQSLSGTVDFSISARALFASDASNYRIVPLGVVFPHDEHDVLTTLEIARRHGVSIVQRGGGTSTGGQTVGPGLVIDYSRNLDKVLEINVAESSARVEPGIVLDVLQDAVLDHNLRFGPDPSTHDRCTIGGMIGNNACGAHSMRWGKTDANVLELKIATYAGEVLSVSTIEALADDPSPYAQQLSRSFTSFVERYGDAIRTQMGPPMPRRVSGYGLSHLLPEHGGNLARALVGTEGTCVALLDATLRLVRPPTARVLLILGFTDLYAAADFVPELLTQAPLTIEGLDARLVDLARNTNESGSGASLLPSGNGWLLLEIGGNTGPEAIARAEEIVEALGATPQAPSSRIVSNALDQRAVWRLREDGAGLATRLPDGSEAWPGWEDAAVPPEQLGAYLRGFDALLAEHGRQGMHYGHYGEGCMHIRIDFDFLIASGRTDFRRFIEAAADLVVSFGGSLSGEHGDGQARSELLHKMYPPAVLEAFREFKEIFDPTYKMNPGRIVAPRLLDADLRVRIPVRVMDK